MTRETICITGANRGIGLALAAPFARAGHRVVATCRGGSDADSLRRAIEPTGGSLCTLDVTEPSAPDVLAGAIRGQRLDLLIHNAGVFGGPRQALNDMDVSAWREAFEVNAIAPFRLTSALLPALRRSSRPWVLTLSSQMGALSRKSTGNPAYHCSKAAAAEQILSRTTARRCCAHLSAGRRSRAVAEVAHSELLNPF
ncbi:MAG: SDR family NAD(P)-dependent oxidoreductase [Pseudomonadales bacterium]|jgi:NAD(P)-dependent dehydrogenase (short-subunit alcohol dehydrogenase family)|nr:SDR family NAD(P)-dependent oxidoreductase [Pseudomonadales bacterium]